MGAGRGADKRLVNRRIGAQSRGAGGCGRSAARRGDEGRAPKHTLISPASHLASVHSSMASSSMQVSSAGVTAEPSEVSCMRMVGLAKLAGLAKVARATAGDEPIRGTGRATYAVAAESAASSSASALRRNMRLRGGKRGRSRWPSTAYDENAQLPAILYKRTSKIGASRKCRLGRLIAVYSGHSPKILPSQRNDIEAKPNVGEAVPKHEGPQKSRLPSDGP